MRLAMLRGEGVRTVPDAFFSILAKKTRRTPCLPCSELTPLGLSAFADSLSGDTFDAAKAAEGGDLRLQSAARLRQAVLKALGQIHAVLNTEQRAKARLPDPHWHHHDVTHSPFIYQFSIPMNSPGRN